MTPSAGAAWTDLGDGVRVRSSRAFAMNTVVLASPDHVLVADPGVLPSELDDLARATGGRAPADVTLFFTHGDWDHVLGRPWWPGARTVGHDALAAEVRRHRDTILAEARSAAEAAGETWTRGFEPFRPDLEVSGLHVARIGPWHVVLRDARGHSASMLSMHVPELGLWIAGDMLSDIEIPTLVESPARYRRALDDLALLAEHDTITRLVPGHGEPARDSAEVRARITADLGYLNALADDVREAREARLTREQAVARIERIAHPAARAPGMAEHHGRNVALAFDEATGDGGVGRRRRPAPPRA